MLVLIHINLNIIQLYNQLIFRQLEVRDKDKAGGKQYGGKPDWERLKKNPNEPDKGSPPKMGKGKVPTDNPEKEKVN